MHKDSLIFEIVGDPADSNRTGTALAWLIVRSRIVRDHRAASTRPAGRNASLASPVTTASGTDRVPCHLMRQWLLLAPAANL